MDRISWIEKIFLYNQDAGTPGLSQDLFFTRVYFWIFLGVTLFFMFLIHRERNRIGLVATVLLVAIGLFSCWVLDPHFLILYFIWSFFGIFVIFYAWKDKRALANNTFLFLASLFFYYKSGGAFFLILVFTTVINYFLGLIIGGSNSKGTKKFVTTFSVIVNLLVLAIFKYAYFFSDSFQVFLGTLNQVFDYDFATQWDLNIILEKWSAENLGKGLTFSRIILPVGISFFTFQAISYTVDIYRGDLKPLKNIMNFGFYVSFFPQLVMGPIVRASDFIPQMFRPYRVSQVQFGMAIFWILNGLLKKAFLADFIANGFIDFAYQQPDLNSGFQCVMAMFGYSLQVYADFSGYTDMAIGIGFIMGYRFKQNFNSPYKALNVGEFWKRWHISLSTWLRDYLYIPLGGNRKGSYASYILLGMMILIMLLLSQGFWLKILIISVVLLVVLAVLSFIFPNVKRWVNTNVNLMITMLLGGLWHGASWNMVIWGGLNGLGLVVYKLWRKISPYEKINAWWSNTIKILVTLTFISITRIFFRSDNMVLASSFMNRITDHFGADSIGAVISKFWFYYLILIVGYAIHLIPVKGKNMYRNWFIRSHIVVKGIIILIVAIISYQSLQAAQPFIYFKF